MKTKIPSSFTVDFTLKNLDNFAFKIITFVPTQWKIINCHFIITDYEKIYKFLSVHVHEEDMLKTCIPTCSKKEESAMRDDVNISNSEFTPCR